MKTMDEKNGLVGTPSPQVQTSTQELLVVKTKTGCKPKDSADIGKDLLRKRTKPGLWQCHTNQPTVRLHLDSEPSCHRSQQNHSKGVKLLDLAVKTTAKVWICLIWLSGATVVTLSWKTLPNSEAHWRGRSASLQEGRFTQYLLTKRRRKSCQVAGLAVAQVQSREGRSSKEPENHILK